MNNRNLFVCAFLSIQMVSLLPSHTINKHFPFLESPNGYTTTRNSTTSCHLFLTSASTAFRQSDGGTISIPSLEGSYDLQNLIFSIQEATENSSYNPFQDEIGYTDWNEKTMKFSVDGKVKSRGITLEHQQRIPGTKHFYFGAKAPLMDVNTSQRFAIDREGSDVSVRNATSGEATMLDRVRREVHSDLGLRGDDWSTSGLGDIDAYVRFNKTLDHKLKFRTINFNLRSGVLIPTGKKRDYNYPSSVPFMGASHWGLYLDMLSELELKQNWRFGFLWGITKLFKKTDRTRISVYREPAPFSRLIGDLEIDPGITFQLAPYFTLENVSDGLNLQVRYSYISHRKDSFYDARTDKSLHSYLQREDTNRWTKRIASQWKMHYLTFQLHYDSKEAMQNWWFTPDVYFVYDYPLQGRGPSKVHQLSLGVGLHW
jgi:hypothetical protein